MTAFADPRRYRLTEEARRMMAVQVTVAKDQIARGRAVDISPSGIGVQFPANNPPDFAVGSKVLLEVHTEALDCPVITEVSVRYRSNNEDGRKYGFRFQNEGGNTASFLIGVALERRRSPRAVPPAPLNLDIMSQDAGLKLKTDATDISPVGVGFRLSFPEDRCFAIGDHVRIAFTLPGDRIARMLPGRIYSMRDDAKGTNFGVGFIEQRSVEYRSARPFLDRYISWARSLSTRTDQPPAQF